MKVRQHVFDAYWMFAAERQAIFFQRLLKCPAPWTQDPILAAFKFCNAYRASDRVSQYLIKNVIYDWEWTATDTVFRILLFKIFNKIETWEYLERALGSIDCKSFDSRRYSVLLEQARRSGQPIYTNAYMSCANKAFGYDQKHDNHLALIACMMTENVIDKILAAPSLEHIYNILVAYPLIGPFMAYQLATDLNYAPFIHHSEQSFTVAGPGAVRGIQKCFQDTNGKNAAYIIQWMCDHQDHEFDRLGLTFQSLWGRPLQYIDCQNLFCETDKYSRVAFPDLASNRTRIKAKFQPQDRQIDYFYPPKWGLNQQVQASLRRCGS
jgi:hypothetical protein